RMKKDEGLTELIYEYYESRILFGYYRYGEQLVSLSQICSTFQVGRNTVLAALKKLEEKGYIVTEERKVARITYQGTDEIFLENTAKYF
ncbi:GntR family transcriptional regulator, partial [Eggerthella lenta]|uniref:GntR family transcriptional regulator n=1 Tax=Eggerthella lenta TaxID=84112 RepID=UPI001D068D98